MVTLGTSGTSRGSSTTGAREEGTGPLTEVGSVDHPSVHPSSSEMPEVTRRPPCAGSSDFAATSDSQGLAATCSADSVDRNFESAPTLPPAGDAGCTGPSDNRAHQTGKRKRRELPPVKIDEANKLRALRRVRLLPPSRVVHVLSLTGRFVLTKSFLQLSTVAVDWYGFDIRQRFIQGPPFLEPVPFGFSTLTSSPDCPPTKRTQLDSKKAAAEESPGRLVVRSGYIGWGSSGWVFRSTMGDISLIVKVCRSRDGLVSEVQNYKTLEDSLEKLHDDGSPLVPLVVGRFVAVDDDRSFLLMEDCGDKMPQFEFWTEADKDARFRLTGRSHC